MSHFSPMDGENEIGTILETTAGAVDAAIGLEERQSYVGSDIGLVGFVGGGVEGELSGKRKRGRPRKPQVGEMREELVFMAEPSAYPQKRGRGRPKGSGKWQTLAASLGEFDGDSAGSKFTPHTITIQPGENIVQRFCSFAQRASESLLCILSASGTVSCAEIRQAGPGGSILKYEVIYFYKLWNNAGYVCEQCRGRFEIISLSGSNLENVNGGVHGKVCLLSVQLANPDGGLFGGAVAGSLIASGPTQLVIASFRQNLKEQVKGPQSIEPPPRTNDNVFTAPLQEANGNLLEAEVNGPSSISPISAAPPPVNATSDSVLNVNYSSPHPFDWTSLQPSTSISHVVIPNRSGVNDHH